MVFRTKKALIKALPIERGAKVLDVGFVGQAVQDSDAEWPHGLLAERTDALYGVDLDFDVSRFPGEHYLKASAGDFMFPVLFDCIFAGDVIEHLSNPGLFLNACKRALKPGGVLVITTPNAFSFFPLIEKLTHDEPNVNPDHTCYFNKRTLAVLLQKNGFQNPEYSYLYTLGTLWNGGWKRKFLASLYWFTSLFTPKFLESLVVTVKN